jgi:metal-dependent amidase/aminoacylase/carboxypeptidase family protein
MPAVTMSILLPDRHRASIQQLKDQWAGRIIFVGQPGEEAIGGARALLKDGLYDRFGKPNFGLGFHDNAQMPIGHIGVTEGYTYANVDSVDVTVFGVSGHGAYPHKTKDGRARCGNDQHVANDCQPGKQSD